MADLEQVLTEIAGKNALNANCKQTQKLCKAINYLSTQLSVQLNAFASDDDKQEVNESVASVRSHAASILSK